MNLIAGLVGALVARFDRRSKSNATGGVDLGDYLYLASCASPALVGETPGEDDSAAVPAPAPPSPGGLDDFQSWLFHSIADTLNEHRAVVESCGTAVETRCECGWASGYFYVDEGDAEVTARWAHDGHVSHLICGETVYPEDRAAHLPEDLAAHLSAEARAAGWGKVDDLIDLFVRSLLAHFRIVQDPTK